MIVIYKLERDNIPFYVGYTKNPKQRESAHRLKYGTDIILIGLETVVESVKKIRESYWIEKLKDEGFELLNLNEGGGGPTVGYRSKSSINGFKEKRKNWSRKGIPQPPTYKERITLALKGKPKPEGFGDMMREVRLGVPKPEGMGLKVSQKLKGKSKPKQYKAVVCLSLKDEYIADYESINMAAEITKLNASSISKVCRGKMKSTGGYKWKFKLEI
jgi:hypothetical protein